MATAVLSLPLLVNPALETRSDAIIHIGITRAILRSGVPPSNPFLAGEALPYYWFYNGLVALLTAASRIDPGTVMILLNILGLLVLLILVFRTVSLATGRRSNGLLAAGLTIFGLNGWGWLLLLRVISRKGLSSLGPILSGGVWTFLPQIVMTRWEGTMGFMLTKFWVANSFSIGLVAVTAALYFLFRFFRTQKFASAGGFFLFALLAALLNIIAGGSFAIICLCFFLLRLIVPGGQPTSGGRWAVYGIILILLLVPFLIPYLTSIAPSSPNAPSMVYFQMPDRSQLRILAVIPAPLWILALITFKRRGDERTQPARSFLTVAVILLSVGFLFLRFAKHNEFKLPFLIALFLSLLIGMNAKLSRRTSGLIVWVILLSTIPTTALGLIAYSCSPVEEPVTPDEAAIYSWIDRNLPREAILISERRTKLIPLLGDRDAYLSCYTFLKSTPVDRALIKERRDQIRRLQRGKNAAGVLNEIFHETGQPLGLIWYSGNLQSSGLLSLLHIEGKIKVWGLGLN